MLLETLIVTLAILNTGVAQKLINVALDTNGGICLGSSSSPAFCHRAIDGKVDHNHQWASIQQGKGSWIKLQFNDFYMLDEVRFMQLSHADEQSKDLLLTFSDGSSQKVTLTKNNATSWKEDIALWDTFKLKPVWTQTVKITVLTVYSTFNNGFREVEFYAYTQNDQKLSTSEPQAMSSSKSSVFPAVESSWTSWHEWNKCICLCDGSFRVRTRCCTRVKGHTCEGIDQEVRLCNQDISNNCTISFLTTKDCRQRVDIITVLSFCILLFLCVTAIVLLLRKFIFNKRKTAAVPQKEDTKTFMEL